jgi:hypothetical protein
VDKILFPPTFVVRAGEDIGRGMRVKTDMTGELIYLADPASKHLFVTPEDIKVGQLIEVNLATGQIRVLPERK